MATWFPIGKKVKVTAKSPVPVAGSNDDHTGKTGTVRAYTDMLQEDVIHVITLDEPLVVFLPSEPLYDPVSGAKLPGHKVEWIEVPGSCLS
jgi:hypothetical protein